MQIWREKYLIKAPAAHVYQCFTDMAYFEKEFKSQAKGQNVRFKYDRSKPFISPNELTVFAKEPLFRLSAKKNIANEYLLAEYVPIAKSLSKFGGADIECSLTEHNNQTLVKLIINSHKQPGFFMRIFSKLIIIVLMFQSRDEKKKFNKYIESSV